MLTMAVNIKFLYLLLYNIDMRCFIGAELPYKTREKIYEIGKILNGKRVDIENLHITIKFLGELGGEQISDIEKSLSFLDNYNSIPVRINGVGMFPSEVRPRVIWIGIISNDFRDLMENVDDALYPKFKKERSYVPHITIARVNSISEDERNKLSKVGFVDEIKIEKISLFKSKLLQTGAVYSRIKTWSLK